MAHDFDRVLNRRGTDSIKWGMYGEDVLPLWVADMDFMSPPAVTDVLRARVEEGFYGYGSDLPALRHTIQERLERLYSWQVAEESIVFLPGLVSGLNVVCRAVGAPGDGVLVNTPVYGPFLTAPGQQQRVLQTAVQTPDEQDGILHYTMDFTALEAAIDPTTRLFILCNPHNPTGRAYSAAELKCLAELCARHNLIVCSDEIHCDLLLDGARHTPLATLDAEMEAHTITLMAPSKTFNVPGLGCSFAVIPNHDLRSRVQQAAAGIVPHVNILGMHAALAAYRDGAAWLDELRTYLTANREYIVQTVREWLPGVRMTVPEATYLAWLDFGAFNLEPSPYQFFLKEAKVALSAGTQFGRGGEGFVRLNFGCPRATLSEALDRMQAALAAR